MTSTLKILRNSALAQIREMLNHCDEKDLRDIHAELKRLVSLIEEKRREK